MKSIWFLVLTFAAAFLILAGLSSCKKQTANNKPKVGNEKPTPQPAFEKLTFDQIKGKESEMKTDQIPLKKDGVYSLKPGREIIIFKTGEGRYGKMILTKTESYLITFKGVCYNEDGSVHKLSEELKLSSSWGADLDMLKQDKNNIDILFNSVSEKTSSLVPKNKAKFAVLK